MSFKLPELPYSMDALEPHISARTLQFHHGKHHAAYVNKLNSALESGPRPGETLEEIILATHGKDDQRGVFNNAAQVWNHTFFWHSMAPGAKGPEGKLAERIEKDLGGLDKLKKTFVETGMGQFGSGWVWLVMAGDRLEVVSTPNAVNPITAKQTPLLTCDVWEHAYYLDYQNRRADFLETFVDKLANWAYAAERLGG